MEIEREKDVLTHRAAEIARYSLDEDMSQTAAPIRQKLEQFRSTIKQGTVSPKTKRRILEQFVESVTIHLKKGSPLHWTVREVMPFRPNMTLDLQENQKTTVWARNGAAKQEPEARVVVCYRFPWPSLDPALGMDVITSHSHARE